MKKLTQTAFTIIELLIVITVIGIIAGIVLNVVGGAQDRAANAKAITTAKQWVKALQAYEIDNGTFFNPESTAPGTISYHCVGLGYTDVDGDGTGECRALEIFGNWTNWDEDPAISNQLTPYIGNELPIIRDEKIFFVAGPRDFYFGAHFEVEPSQEISGTGESVPVTLGYYLVGADQDCGVSPLVEDVADGMGGIGYITDRNYVYTFLGADITYCRIAIKAGD